MGTAIAGHILVVDDNRMNRLLLARSLEQQGHQVAFAENGRQALELARAQPFDVILSDIEMPEMNGYQLLEQFLADPHLRDTPVIMVSSVDEMDGVVKCIEMGAEDYLHKPFNAVLLKARVGASIEKKRLRDSQRELIRKFATNDVAEQLLTSGFTLGGTLVEATVLFCDIRSFTTIAESLSPADTIELLNTYYALMLDPITAEGGIVNQFIGDGLMAIFGAPVPRDAPQQHAVRAALQMVELIEQFSQQQAQLNAPQIRIGVGIASGHVIAGYAGTQRRVTYTCIGDVVNLAARLETHTKVVQEPILIEEHTRQGLDGSISVVPHGEVLLKGKTHAVSIYSVPAGQPVR